MTSSEFKKIVRDLTSLSAETETVEFKANNFDFEAIGKRISALSNSSNILDEKAGYMLFGVEDGSHKIVGTSFDAKAEKRQGQVLELWLSQRLNPKVDFRIYTDEVDGKRLVLIEIPPALDRPVSFDRTAYIRVGSATTKLSDYPDKEAKIWTNAHKKNYERGIAKEHCTVSDVLRILDYSKYLELTGQEIPSHTAAIVEKLEQHELVHRILDDNYDVTNLGALLFANDISIFHSVRRKAVRVIVYEGTTRDKIKKDREDNSGYAAGFESLINFIGDQLPSNEEISKTLRREVKMYPDVAIREFVANALIHQDLSISGAGPKIEIFSNRIEITNPGNPLIEPDRFIDHPPRSRNEDMASFMRLIGICEEGGTGIDRALGEIALYQLPAPKFETYNEFTRVTLYDRRPLKNMTRTDKIRACYQHCVLKYVENTRMTNESLRERLGIEKQNYPIASTIIRETIEAGYIKPSDKPKEYVPVWA